VFAAQKSPIDHAVLHFDGAANCVDHTAKLDDAAVAGALDHTPVMHGDGEGDQIAPAYLPRRCR
jgi:hypothetical protein